MGIKRFRVFALTPVHVGTGESISPEDYYLDGANGDLVRFHPPIALAAMSPQERSAYEALIDQNKMNDALQKLRVKASSTPGANLYRVATSAAARADLQPIIRDLDSKRGEIRPLPRNPHTGAIYIPGSAIKGAIRTALMSSIAAQKLKSRWPQLQQELRSLSQWDAKKFWGRVQQQAFGASGKGREVDLDPFRHLRVSDLAVTSGRAIVSRARIFKRDGDTGSQEKIRMYYERLESIADGKNGCLGEVSITVVQASDRDNKLGQTAMPLTWDFVGSECGGFFQRRWRQESEHFSWLYSGWTASFPSSGRPAILLRLGRFNHFESLSIDGLRRGSGFKGKPLYEAGSSRTACVLDGDRTVPFGWVVLQEAA